MTRRTATPRRELVRLSASDWYVAVILSGGLWLYLQTVFPVLRVGSLAAIAYVLVLLQALAVFIVSPRADLTVRGLRTVIAAAALIALIPPVKAIFAGGDPSVVSQDLLFMWGSGVALLACLFHVPRVRGNWLLRGVVAVLFGFGTIQVITQQLMLTPNVQEALGIVYPEFSNGLLRVSSLMASAARFGELAVAVALIAGAKLLRGQGRLGTLAVLAISVLLLMNTFSRANYISLMVGGAAVLILTWATYWQRRIPTMVVYTTLAIMASAYFWFTWIMASGALDDTSLIARTVRWSEVNRIVARFGVADWLLGSGISARLPAGDPNRIVFDNVYLAHFMYGGILGLAVFLVFAVLIVVSSFRSALTHGGTIIPMAALFVSLLVSGLFLDNHNTINVVSFALVGVLASATDRDSAYRESSFLARPLVSAS